MRVELGATVLLERRGTEIAQTGVWHLPVQHGLAEARERSSRWRTLCGLPGELYRYGGSLRGLRCCGVCRRLAPALVRSYDAPDVVGRGPRRRATGKPRGKPAGKWGKATDTQLRALHKAYVEKQLSCYALGELVWQRLGYASARSCAMALYDGFRRLGLPTRSQSEATAMRNWKHGRRQRSLGETGPAIAEYRRWLKQEPGRYRPVCAAVKKQPPGKGRPCRRPALADSEYCFSHDPRREAERATLIAAMHTRLPKREMVAWADVEERLRPLIAGERYPAMALSRVTGVPNETIRRLLKGGSERLTAELAGRLLAPLASEELRDAA